MSTSNFPRPGTGAGIGDCGRLWATLTTEYIPKLRIEMRIHHDPAGDTYLLYEVVDDSVISEGGEQLVNVWATKEFHNQLYLISISQLFDLLIQAYRQIDGYFSLGAVNAPTLRRR